MKPQRRNSKKSLEEAGKIQHRIRYFNVKNLTEEVRAELYAVYQKSFDKGRILDRQLPETYS